MDRKERMNFSRMFDTYSRRTPSRSDPSKPLTDEFRFRVMKLCTSVFPYVPFGAANYLRRTQETVFWQQVQEKLAYQHGRGQLSQVRIPSPTEDALAFLDECNDDHFLDFIELIFECEIVGTGNVDFVGLIEAINEFLRVDDLPYELTIHNPPKIIRRENTVVHHNAIEPTLLLLSDPRFKSANDEFHDALVDYRRGDYGDCVAKCGSSFESAMKIICDLKGWSYKQDATSGPLLDVVVGNSALEAFFTQPLMLVATIRNRLSSAHGAGNQSRTVDRHVAQFAINATASAILLLVEETNP